MATWSEFTFLSAAQRTALQGFADLGAQVKGPPNGETGPTPSPTFSQTKTADVGFLPYEDLFKVTRRGIRYAMAFYRRKAVKDFEDANP